MRSTLKTIQLIATVTYPNLQQYGFEPVLKPFIEDMNKFSEVRERCMLEIYFLSAGVCMYVCVYVCMYVCHALEFNNYYGLNRSVISHLTCVLTTITMHCVHG